VRESSGQTNFARSAAKSKVIYPVTHTTSTPYFSKK
jgi:hypothetical protein